MNRRCRVPFIADESTFSQDFMFETLAWYVPLNWVQYSGDTIDVINGDAHFVGPNHSWFSPHSEREFFIDNLLVRIHSIIEMIKWTGLAPWGF